MDSTSLISLFESRYEEVVFFSLMEPLLWSNELPPELVTKFNACYRIRPKIHEITQINVLQKLCQHLQDILDWIALQS
jgi:hypothetical protein